MTLDMATVNVILLAAINIVIITGAYWKLKLEIKDRPTFKQVENMIARDAFPAADGKVLKSKIESIETNVKTILDKLEEALKPKKEFK